MRLKDINVSNCLTLDEIHQDLNFLRRHVLGDDIPLVIKIGNTYEPTGGFDVKTTADGKQYYVIKLAG